MKQKGIVIKPRGLGGYEVIFHSAKDCRNFVNNKLDILLPIEINASPIRPFPKPNDFFKIGKITSIRGSKILVDSISRITQRELALEKLLQE